MKALTPRVDVIIPHYGPIDNLRLAVESVLKSNYNNFSIIIVNDDPTINVSELESAKVRIINNKVNLGFAESCNIGFYNSNACYAFLLNNDATVSKNCINELVKIAERDKSIFSAQPKIMSMFDKQKFYYAGAAGGFIYIYGYPLCRGRVFDTIEKDVGQYDDIIETFWSCGAAMLLRSELLQRTGGFDKDFFAYGEEIDLCWRARILGYKHVFVPKAKIYHLGEASFKKFRFKKYYLLHRNHLNILLKNYSTLTLFKIFPIKLLLEFLSCYKFLVDGNFARALSVVIAVCSVFINLPSSINKHKSVQDRRVLSDKQVMDKMVKQSVSIYYHLFNKNSFEYYAQFL